MKKSLRLLASLSLLLATASSQAVTQPTLTQDWKYDTGLLPATSKQGIGIDGKIYISDNTAAKLYYYDKDGQHVFKTPGLSGSGITIDEAGNLIVRTNYFASGTDMNLRIYNIADGYTTYKDLNLNFAKQVPNGQRMDFNGKASGNLLSEAGGQICVYGTGKSAIDVITIKSGAFVETRSIATTNAANTESIAYPYGDLIIGNPRTTVTLYKYDKDGNETTYNTPNRNSTTGTDFFTLNGEEYLIYNTGTQYCDGFIIRNMTTGVIVHTHAATKSTASASHANWVNAEKTSEFTANIYQYNATNVVAKYTFEIPNPYPAPTAFSITTDTKYDAAKGKNIFTGFKSTWTAPTEAPAAGYTLKEYVLNNGATEIARTTATEATIYGISEACKISIKAVYINGADTKESAAAEANFTPADVVATVAVNVPAARLTRYTTDGMYRATLTWNAPATYPVANYMIAYADATAGAPAEASYIVKESTWNGDWTGIDQLVIENVSKLADNPTGVKINYIVYPGFNIGNTIKTSIADADYNDNGISTIKYPTFAEVSADGVRGEATFTVDMIQTGVEDVETSKVAVYPNPTEGVINITATNAIGEVVLYNLSGGLAAKFNGNGESALTIDISDFSAGTYFLKAGTQVTKIIKK